MPNASCTLGVNAVFELAEEPQWDFTLSSYPQHRAFAGAKKLKMNTSKPGACWLFIYVLIA